MSTTINPPKGTRMVLSVGANGNVLEAWTPDGQPAVRVSDADAAQAQQTDPANPKFQGIGATGGRGGTAAMTTSGETYCYWIKLHGNGWVKICW